MEPTFAPNTSTEDLLPLTAFHVASLDSLNEGPVSSTQDNCRLGLQTPQMSTQQAGEPMSFQTAGGESSAAVCARSPRLLKRLTRGDYAIILDWLQMPGNMDLLMSTKKRARSEIKIKRGYRYPVKIEVFKGMLPLLHSRGFPKEITNEKSLARRFKYYMGLYDKVLRLREGPTFEVTEPERCVGFTKEDKLNMACPHFERLRGLFEDWAKGLLCIQKKRKRNLSSK